MLIGITGTLGAGKGTVAECLVENGFKHFSVRAFLLEEIRKRDLEENRDSMVAVANDLRKKHLPSYIVERLIEQAVSTGGNAVVESVRVPGEVEELKKAGGILLSVDADIEKRYERIVARKSETDQVSFEEFKENEEREMNSSDPDKQNITAVMRMADIHLKNNGSIDDLKRAVKEKIL